MAHSHMHRSIPVDFGSFIHDHMSHHDAMNGSPARNERTPSSDGAVRKTSNSGGHDGTQSSEDQENDGEEPDSSADHDVDDDEEEPDRIAPSYIHGKGKGKGKHPAIHVVPAGDEELEDDDDVSLSRTGLHGGKDRSSAFGGREKKRTFSNVSTTNSVLFDNQDLSGFPRRKIPRHLSNGAGKGLLTYKEPVFSANSDSDLIPAYEMAIDSGDEETQEAAQDPALDDEDYSGVYEVDDDSDAEQELEREEEKWLIAEAEQMPGAYNLDRRFSVDSNAFDVSAQIESNLLADDIPDVDFDDFFSRPDTPDAPAGRKYSSSSTKRVRFDDDVQMTDSSDSETSGIEDSMFPDLFMPQDKLDPDFRRIIENDDNQLSSSDSENSYWSLGQDDTFATQVTTIDPTGLDSESEAGSSGYETDSGDTTDEEDFEPLPAVQATISVLRRPSSSGSDKPSSPMPFQRSSRTRISARQISSRQIISRIQSNRRSKTGNFEPPRCGVFTHEDWSKAIAVTNRTTELTTYYRPRRALSERHANYVPSSISSTANNSPCTSVIFPVADDSDYSEVATHSMIPSDIMLSGVFGAAPNSLVQFGGQTYGPPEAFYPWVAVPDDLMQDDDDDSDYSDDDEFLDINALIDFGGDPDETDAAEETDIPVPATPSTSMIVGDGSTPAQPTPGEPTTPVPHRRNASDAMLEHFDRTGGVVTAFRNNQNRFRDFARLPFNPDQRASASTPVRSGRSADTLISPLRKRGSISKRIAGPPLFSGVAKTARNPIKSHRAARGPPAGTFA